MGDVDAKRPIRVFLSYASEDKPAASYIAGALKQSGVSPFFDEWELAWGDSLVERVSDAVASSDYVVVLLSPASVGSNWVRREINATFSRELKDRAVRLLPVLIADCEIPMLLRDRVYLDLRHDREAGVQRLVAELSAVPAIQFSALTPRDFEHLVGDLLVELGFSVDAQTPETRDRGFDFRAVYKSRDPFGVEKSDVWLVEAKLYRDSRVSIAVLREAVALLASWRDAMMALVITSGNITSEARRFLAESGYASRVRVIEGPELTNLIARYPALIARHFPRGGNRA